jgi:hypothetical protein
MSRSTSGFHAQRQWACETAAFLSVVYHHHCLKE